MSAALTMWIYLIYNLSEGLGLVTKLACTLPNQTNPTHLSCPPLNLMACHIVLGGQLVAGWGQSRGACYAVVAPVYARLSFMFFILSFSSPRHGFIPYPS